MYLKKELVLENEKEVKKKKKKEANIIGGEVTNPIIRESPHIKIEILESVDEYFPKCKHSKSLHGACNYFELDNSSLHHYLNWI